MPSNIEPTVEDFDVWIFCRSFSNSGFFGLARLSICAGTSTSKTKTFQPNESTNQIPVTSYKVKKWSDKILKGWKNKKGHQSKKLN